MLSLLEHVFINFLILMLQRSFILRCVVYWSDSSLIVYLICTWSVPHNVFLFSLCSINEKGEKNGKGADRHVIHLRIEHSFPAHYLPENLTYGLSLIFSPFFRSGVVRVLRIWVGSWVTGSSEGEPLPVRRVGEWAAVARSPVDCDCLPFIGR